MITVEQARRGLVKAIEAKGEDYIYELSNNWCYYQYGGSPSCLVGHAIYTIDPIAFWDLSEEESKHEEDGLPIELATSVELEPLARTALSAAQFAQDRGEPWGAALRAFDRCVEGRSTAALVMEVLGG